MVAASVAAAILLASFVSAISAGQDHIYRRPNRAWGDAGKGGPLPWNCGRASDAVRILVGLSAYAWTERVLAPDVTPIRVAHLIELRAALDEAYSSAAQPRPAYTDAGVGAGTLVRAAHINELRTAVVALEGAKPDLVVGRPTVLPAGILAPRQPFILSVTVRNQGLAPARRSPLRYLWSTNSTITPNDHVISVDDSFPALAAGRAIEASNDLIAQGYTSTLYLGACIDPVSGESDTDNNCSPGAPVTVIQ